MAPLRRLTAYITLCVVFLVAGASASSYASWTNEQWVAEAAATPSFAALAWRADGATSLRTLRVDGDSTKLRRQVHNASLSPVALTPFTSRRPSLALLDEAVAASLGISAAEILQQPDIFAEYFTGQAPLQAAVGRGALPLPYAHAYAGYQFGSWAGQLGDGRAISLGEVDCSAAAASEGCVDSSRSELSVKGAGKTAYSRSGDGRAVLASLGREFLGGVALHALHVPTCRCAICLVCVVFYMLH